MLEVTQTAKENLFHLKKIKADGTAMTEKEMGQTLKNQLATMQSTTRMKKILADITTVKKLQKK
jgi:hypothetical protein